MSGPEDSHGNTRPISVAELLAKNGTIGAPPVGGRRRRRRGNSDSVTVAELTGEIPIVSGHDVDEAVTAHQPAVPTNGVAGHVDEVKAEAAAELEAESAAAEPEAESAEAESAEDEYDDLVD